MRKTLMTLSCICIMLIGYVITNSQSARAQVPQTERESENQSIEKNKPIPNNPIPASVRKMGQPVDTKAVVTLEKLFEAPSEYIGKTITICGTVTEGCHHSGKWVRISDGKNNIDAFATNDWRFPTDHKGLKATVTGIFQSQKLTGDALKAYIEHQNSEHNGHLHEKDYPDGLIIYQIKVSGCTLE